MGYKLGDFSDPCMRACDGCGEEMERYKLRDGMCGTCRWGE